MRVTHIEYKNLLGLRALEFSPGTITEVTANNGDGKTSIVEGLLGLIKGGRDVTMVKRGEEKGTIAILLDDGGHELRIEKTWHAIEGKAPKVKITRDDKPIQETPQAFLNSIFGRLVNPMDFLNGTEEEQTRWLLESMQINATVAQLKAAAVPNTAPAKLEMLARSHGLVAVDTLYAEAYDLRRDCNVKAIAKRKTEEQLRSGLPAEEEMNDWAGAAAKKREELGGLRAQLRRVEETADQLLETEHGAAHVEFLKAKEEINKTFQLRVDALNKLVDEARAEAATQTREAERQRATRLQEAQDQKDAQVVKAREGMASQIELTVQDLGRLQAAADHSAHNISLRKAADAVAAEAVELEEEWKIYHASLESLDALRAKLLEQLPIPGLEFKGGKIFRDGIPLRRLNTQQQMDISMQVAELDARRCGFLVIDGIERLDPPHFAEMIERCKDTGLQYIMTRVPSTAECNGIEIRMLA